MASATERFHIVLSGDEKRAWTSRLHGCIRARAEADTHGIARLTARVEQLEGRERETRERLVYMEGIVAGARARAGAKRLERD